jgi:putative flippase GtrA
MQKTFHFPKLLAGYLEFKVVRYFFVGGAAAVVDLSLFFIFAWLLGFNYLLVGVGAFTVAAIFNYLLSIRYVFVSGARFCGRKEFAWVYLVSICGLLLNQIILYISVAVLHQDMMLAKIAAIGLVFGWNYLARKHFVFKTACP